MRKSKSSCFIDACELAFGGNAEIVAELYKKLAPAENPDETGYHPSLVNMIYLENHESALTEIDLVPVNQDGSAKEDHEKITGTVIDWFKRPGFACVLTGPNVNGEEHAIAWRGGRFIDPANTELVIEEPTIQIRSVWVLTLPKMRVEQTDAN